MKYLTIQLLTDKRCCWAIIVLSYSPARAFHVFSKMAAQLLRCVYILDLYNTRLYIQASIMSALDQRLLLFFLRETSALCMAILVLVNQI